MARPWEERWRVLRLSNGCVVWTGGLNSAGYGMIVIDGVRWLVHRWAYTQAYGQIPEGLTIDHVRARGCLYRHCVEPTHLEAVPRGVNVLRGDGPTAKHARQTHCQAGHEFTDANTWRGDGHRVCRTCLRERLRLYRQHRAG